MADKEYETFGEVRSRLDEIVAEVRSKDVSLEKSLDLYEEAIQLGNRCAELIDKPDYTTEEITQASEAMGAASMGQDDDPDALDAPAAEDASTEERSS